MSGGERHSVYRHDGQGDAVSLFADLSPVFILETTEIIGLLSIEYTDQRWVSSLRLKKGFHRIMVYYFGKGRYQALYDALFEQLVPKQGPADSMQGELVRCISRLSSEYYRNGNINFYELDSRPFYADMFHYLRLHLHDTSCFDAAALDELNRDLATLWFFGTGDRGDVFYDGDNIREDEEIDAYDRIIERVIEWCRAHQNLLSREDERTLGITIASLFME